VTGSAGSSFWHWILNDTVIVGALTILWQTWIKTVFAKVLEKSKFNFTRLAANASLYSTKRHDAYVQMWRSLLEAQGNLGERLQTFIRTPSFEDYNEEDIRDFLTKKNTPKAAIEETCGLWRTQKSLALVKVETYWKIYNRHQTESFVTKAQNDSLYLDLYLSDEVSKAVIDIVKNMRSCLSYVNGYAYDADIYKSHQDKALELTDKIHIQMDKLSEKMKGEIRLGHFDESDG